VISDPVYAISFRNRLFTIKSARIAATLDTSPSCFGRFDDLCHASANLKKQHGAQLNYR